MKISTLKKRSGFTMFELLIVVALIGIMISIALASFNAVRSRSRDGERVALVKDIGLALQDYYSRCGSYPGSIDFSTWDNPEPCPLRNGQETFNGPEVLKDATFVSSTNTFQLEQFSDKDFFYVPTQTEVNGFAAVDTCDGYHIGVMLESGNRILLTDDDFNSNATSPSFNGVIRNVCQFADGSTGYDGTHDSGNGAVNTVYDIVQ